MSENSVIYANARVSALLNQLLTADKFQRLLDSGKEADGILHEFGYEGATAEEMTANAIDAIYDFLIEASPVDEVKNALLKKNDYHNAKLLMKGKYLRKEVPANLLYLHSLVDVVRMKDGILADSYVDLPKPMATALEQIDLDFVNGDRRSKRIDCLLTQAMYADMLPLLAGKKEMYRLVQNEIDLANLSATLRIRAYGLEKEALHEEFIAGGTLEEKLLLKFLTLSDDGIKEEVRFLPCRKAVETALTDLAETGALVHFERDGDDAAMELYQKYKAEQSHYMLFFGYVQGRLTEVKNIRIAVSGLRAGTEQAKIKERMRELYV